MANCVIKCCRSVKHFPTRAFCILLLLLQAAVIDYYLVEHKSMYWAAWAGADGVIVTVFFVTFIVAYVFHKDYKHWMEENQDNNAALHSKLGVFAWVVYAVVLSIKVGVSFRDFAPLLDENDFFGPNTLKTAIALAGLVYLLLLSTLHDAKPGSERRRYIEELTGTVIFDILDGVDSMEPLFLKEARDDFPPGLADAIIAIACINFLLPTIPLITLAKTNFGFSKLSQNMVVAHKICLAFLVNLPLLITRMIVWHGASHGVSIFTLKNVIVMSMVTYDLYEHHESEADGGHTSSPKNSKPGSEQDSYMGDQNYALEDRFNYSW